MSYALPMNEAISTRLGPGSALSRACASHSSSCSHPTRHTCGNPLTCPAGRGTADISIVVLEGHYMNIPVPKTQHDECLGATDPRVVLAPSRASAHPARSQHSPYTHRKDTPRFCCMRPPLPHSALWTTACWSFAVGGCRCGWLRRPQQSARPSGTEASSWTRRQTLRSQVG